MNARVSSILLVEDNLTDAKLTTLALKQSNIANKIVHVKDGEQALQFLFSTGPYISNQELPSLVLLDLKMPKVNGIDVLRKVKSADRTKNIPIVVFTSSQEDPDVKECYALGVNSYIVKPLEFSDFSKVVKELGLYWVLINHLPHE